MRELNPIEIRQVGGGAGEPTLVSLDAHLGVLLAPWAAAPVVSAMPAPMASVTLQLPASPQGIDGRTAGS